MKKIAILATGGTIAGRILNDANENSTTFNNANRNDTTPNSANHNSTTLNNANHNSTTLNSASHNDTTLNSASHNDATLNNANHNDATFNIKNHNSTTPNSANHNDAISNSTEYKAGILSVDELLGALPQIAHIAEIYAEQIANIDSCDMTNEILLRLARRACALLDEVDGVVITHGTDTMEESAYFLHLVLPSNKPVVLTGAMRPSNALGSDGLKNLYNAVLVATNAHSSGVLVVMNDRIFDARGVQKTHTLNADAFSGGEVGYVVGNKVAFYHPRNPSLQGAFSQNLHLDNLPKVDILYSYANDGLSIAAHALFESGTRGIVVAGSGAGSIHSAQKITLKELMARGLKVVVSSRVKCGFVALSADDRRDGFIQAGDLNPQKSRILLMFALLNANRNDEIERYFLS